MKLNQLVIIAFEISFQYFSYLSSLCKQTCMKTPLGTLNTAWINPDDTSPLLLVSVCTNWTSWKLKNPSLLMCTLVLMLSILKSKALEMPQLYSWSRVQTLIDRHETKNFTIVTLKLICSHANAYSFV